jgi:uncharacterized membrane protein HdeD (DUF308 family)
MDSMNAHLSTGTVLASLLTAVVAAVVIGATGDSGSVPLLGLGAALVVLGASVVGLAFRSGRGR